jgi:RNA polymerase sigma-70 factor (ECF subfamily)
MDELLTGQTLILYTLHDQTLDRVRVEDQQQSLDRFLAEVERPAFRMADISTRNPDDALDIVQDTMIKWVQKYSHKPQDEWRPLFYAILNSRITDYHRRATLTGRLFSWLGTDEDVEQVDSAPTSAGPYEMLSEEITLDRFLAGLDELSTRQQQVFMLRTWQGFSVAETAKMLKCSEGTIKTHLSRATEALMKAIHQDEEHQDRDKQDNSDD